MNVREITFDDIPAIFEVRIATWHNYQAVEQMTRLGITHESVKDLMLTGTHRGWLCEVEDKVVGFTMGNKANGEMWVVAVLKEHEGKGIGRILMSHVEGWLWSEGWPKIWLTTDPDPSARAVGFYKHIGWSDWKMDVDRYMQKFRPTPAEENAAS